MPDVKQKSSQNDGQLDKAVEKEGERKEHEDNYRREKYKWSEGFPQAALLPMSLTG